MEIVNTRFIVGKGAEMELGETEMLVQARRPSITDQLFEALYSRVLTLALPPGSKISEAEIAKTFGVSRQAARDAFYRLSLLGFLIVKPQRATVVSKISARDIIEARFIRTALEREVVRRACKTLTDAHFCELNDQVAEQEAVLATEDFERFHHLDNLFHQSICEMSGYAFAWRSIREQKAHSDRVRYLSLSFAAQGILEGHKEVLAALQSRDEVRATTEIEEHLSHIQTAIDTLRVENKDWFEADASSIYTT